MARPRLRARGSARGAAADPRAPASGELARAQNGTRCVPATAGRRVRRLQEGEPAGADREPAASIAGRSRTRLVHARGARSPASGRAVAAPASAALTLGRGPALRGGSPATRPGRGTRAVVERLQRLERLRSLEVCLIAPMIEPGWRKAFFVCGGGVCATRSSHPGPVQGSRSAQVWPSARAARGRDTKNL